jgi:hypothetical protein
MSTTIDGSASVTINSGAVLGITSGTAVASTSGTSIDFTSIPSWVKRITVMFAGVSTSGTSNLLIRLTGSGAVETSGYVSDAATASASSGTAASTAGFLLCNSIAATDILSGNFTLCLQNASSNTWAHSGLMNRSGGTGVIISAGYKSITGALTAVRITTVNGTDTFDAGSINILYE